MSRELAHQLLDDAKAGKFVSEEAITKALKATGDIWHTWPEAYAEPEETHRAEN